MPIKKKIISDMTSAMKAGEKERLGALRMLKSKIQMAEVELRRDNGPDYQIEDEHALRAIASYAKQCRDSIESYEKAGREELAARERSELEVVQAYLPKQLGEEELRTLVKQAIEDAGATSPQDIGTVMKILIPRLKGAADGKAVNRMVRELLQGS